MTASIIDFSNQIAYHYKTGQPAKQKEIKQALKGLSQGQRRVLKEILDGKSISSDNSPVVKSLNESLLIIATDASQAPTHKTSFFKRMGRRIGNLFNGRIRSKTVLQKLNDIPTIEAWLSTVQANPKEAGEQLYHLTNKLTND